jgi:hypothetical protein
MFAEQYDRAREEAMALGVCVHVNTTTEGMYRHCNKAREYSLYCRLHRYGV